MKVLRYAIKAGAEIVCWAVIILAVSAFFGLIQITITVKGSPVNTIIPLLAGAMFILGFSVRLFCRFIQLAILVTKPKGYSVE
jgi:hypothetical protein